MLGTVQNARGRPAQTFGIAGDRGVILLADVGATGMRCAAADAAGQILIERFCPTTIASGPEVVLKQVDESFQTLLEAADYSSDAVLGIGINLPGPVDYERNRVVRPPIMTGWHNFPIDTFFSRYGCPLIVEKDVNAMAYGEKMAVYPNVDNMVFVKVGTGIRSGIMINGQLYRGADGAAGDIGHTRILAPPEPQLTTEAVMAPSSSVAAKACRSGNIDCLEAHGEAGLLCGT